MQEAAINKGSRAFTVADVFPLMWAPAHLFHLALHNDNGGFDVTEALVILASLAVLARPKQASLLLGLAGVQLIDWVSQAPYAPDHWNLVAVINLMLLAVAATSGRGRSPVPTALPAIRGAVLIGYGAAAFAKWNSDFFDPVVSCAADLGGQATLGLSDNIPGSGPVLIGLAAGAETLVFLGLLVPKTRPAGARLGLAFHGLFSLGPIIAVWDFTTTLMALFVLFLPAEQLDAAVNRILAAFDGSPVVGLLARHRLAVLGLVAALSLIIGSGRLGNGQLLVWAFFLPYVLIVAVGVFGVSPSLGSQTRTPLPLITLPLLALVAFTALNPYLGLRTTGSFTMFSNLRTEGEGANHFVLDGWHLTDHQNDLVTLDTSTSEALQELADTGQALTASTVRTLPLVDDDVQLTGRRNGTPLTWSEETSDQVLGPLGWFERWFLSFRPVALDGRPTCGN